MINCIVLRESMFEGQNCRQFRIWLRDEKRGLIKTIEGTTIGTKRIITFPSLSVSYINLSITGQSLETWITEIEAYLIDEKLIEK